MKNKSKAFWIWLAVVFVVATLLCWVTRINFAHQQMVTLCVVAAVFAYVFFENILGVASLTLGTALGTLLAGSYAYIIPNCIVVILIFLFLFFYLKKSYGRVVNYIIASAVSAGIMAGFIFFYELIILGLKFGQIAGSFLAHSLEGTLCAIIGFALLFFFKNKGIGATAAPRFKPTRKARRSLK